VQKTTELPIGKQAVSTEHEKFDYQSDEPIGETINAEPIA
jgi:hypothetical protein